MVAKALGGCGIHNAMLYVRGLESDFDKWDLEGFDYASATDAWIAMENYTGPGPIPAWHGRDGAITTTPPTFIDEASEETHLVDDDHDDVVVGDSFGAQFVSALPHRVV